MTNGNEPINSIPDLNNHPSDWYGLTKREYFAGLIIQGLLANPNNDGNPKYTAIHAVEVADELIKELNK